MFVSFFYYTIDVFKKNLYLLFADVDRAKKTNTTIYNKTVNYEKN